MAVKTFTDNTSLPASDINTYLNNGGLIWVASGTFSAVTEVLLDDKFTSEFRNYLLLMDCQSSAGASIFAIQMRSGGSTIATNTYQYQAIDADNTSVTARRNTAQASIRFGANDTNAYHSAQVQIFAPQLTLPTRFISSFLRNNGNISEQAWGANTNATSYDGIRFTVGSGTMTGAYALYGYRIA